MSVANSNPNSIQLSDEITSRLTVHKNISQEILVINVDKVELILRDHHQNIKRKGDWIAYLSICVTIFLTLVTANFNETWGLEASVWKSIFIIALTISLVLLIRKLIELFRCRKKCSVSYVITKLIEKSKNP